MFEFVFQSLLPAPAVSFTMAVISERPGPDSGYGSLEELEEEEEDIKPEMTEKREKRPFDSSCSFQSRANRKLSEENEHDEDIEHEEQESFKLYLKRVQECLAGRSKDDDSMERLDLIIISVYKFRTKSYYLLQIVCCDLRPVN